MTKRPTIVYMYVKEIQVKNTHGISETSYGRLFCEESYFMTIIL